VKANRSSDPSIARAGGRYFERMDPLSGQVRESDSPTPDSSEGIPSDKQRYVGMSVQQAAGACLPALSAGASSK
jgi:hypothetical protein